MLAAKGLFARAERPFRRRHHGGDMKTESRRCIRPRHERWIFSALIVMALMLGSGESAAYGSGTFYSGQIASFKPYRDAEELVAFMKVLGNEAFSRKVHVPEKGWYHRVYIGRYGTAQEAYRDLNRLQKKRVIGEFLVHRLKRNTLPEIPLEKREARDVKPKVEVVVLTPPVRPASATVQETSSADSERKEAAMTIDEATGERSAEFYYILGIVEESKGRHDGALHQYSRAIEKDPQYAAAYNRRGMVYLKRGECNLAIADHSRAITLDPENVEFHFNRGVDYRLTGSLNPAVSDFKTACESGGNQACEALSKIAGK